MKQALALLFFLTLLGVGPVGGASFASHEVLVVPIEGTVDEGMAHLVQRAVAEANAEHAGALLLRVNTPGGLVDAAFQIRDALFDAKMPTVAFVSRRAFSAGALITIAARKIVMAPGASLGAAQPIPNTVKYVAALRSEFSSTAARNRRDPTLAAAMVDVHVDAPAYKEPGAILSFTADEARRAGYADAIATTQTEALRAVGLGALVPREVSYTLGERVARFASTPEVSGLLLSLGALAFFVELQTLHGIAGLLGVLLFGLFFGSHVYAGFSNELVVVLAILGVVGLLIELHVLPGTGVAGAVGIASLGVAVVLAFGSASLATTIQTLAFAIALFAFGVWLLARLGLRGRFMRRLTFTDQQGAEYVAAEDRTRLIGRVGTATSFLRPAGVANIDGERVDVLTDGDFLPQGTPIRVTRVQGARIFVQSIPEVKA